MTDLHLLTARLRGVRDLGDSQLSRSITNSVVSASVTPTLTCAVAGTSLTTESAKTLVRAFAGSRLDYCNGMLYGVIDDLLQRPQVKPRPHQQQCRSNIVSNATSRTILSTKSNVASTLLLFLATMSNEISSF